LSFDDGVAIYFSNVWEIKTMNTFSKL